MTEASRCTACWTQGHVAPGRPGWPVCLVTDEAVVDETSPPHLPEDEFASGLSLNGWLDLIESLDATSSIETLPKNPLTCHSERS